MILALLLAAAAATDPLAPLQPLTGEWAGEGAGGTGGFSFERALQGKVVVRKNFAEYPAPRPRHDDLMVIYAEGAALRADYWDSEGHVIRYTVEATPQKIVFASERFRLTYTLDGPDRLGILFEVAQGKEMKPYITASATRKR